eukprot:2496287-Pyramimonas_sp.AAC.1
MSPSEAPQKLLKSASEALQKFMRSASEALRPFCRMSYRNPSRCDRPLFGGWDPPEVVRERSEE